MPLNPLAPFINSWETRVAQARQAGIPETALQPVFQMDLKRLQAGSAPLTSQEANLALSAAAGSPPIQAPTPHSDLNPLHLLGNAAKDVGEITKGIITLPKTIAHDVSHIGEMPGQIAKGAGEIVHGKFGEGLQDIAKAPGLQELLIAGDFIPGVNAVTGPLTAGVLAGGLAGQALTPQGRQEIERHPLVAFLQALPALSETGLAAKAAEGVKASRVGEAGSAALEHIGLGSKIRENLGHVPARAEAELRKIGEDTWTKANAVWKDTSQEERLDIGRRAALGDPAAIADPRVQATNALIDEQRQRFLAAGEIAQVPVPGGGFASYETTSSVVKAWEAHGKASQKVMTHLDTLEAAKSRLEVATARVGTQPTVAGVLGQLKPLMDKDFTANGAEGKIVQAVQHLENARTGLGAVGEGSTYVGEGIASQLSKAQKLLSDAGLKEHARAVDAIRGGELPKARADYERALQKHQDLKTAKDRSLTNFHKRLQRNPEARFVPKVIDEFHHEMTAVADRLYKDNPEAMKAATDALGKRYYDGTFGDGTPIFPGADKVLRDVSRQWLDWRAKGVDPVFMHKMELSQASQILKPRVFPGRVPTAGVLKGRVLDLSPGYTDLAVAFSHAEMQVAVRDMAQKVLDEHIVPNLTVSSKEEVAKLMKRDPSLSKEEALNRLHEDYIPFTASDYGVKRLSRSLGSDERLIPRHLDREMKRLIPRPENFSGAAGAWNKSIRMYRFAVTGLSPLHMAHVTFSGAMMMAGRTDPVGLLRSLPEAMRLIKNGELPPSLRGASKMSEEDIVTHVAATKTLSRLWEESTHMGKVTGRIQQAQDAMTRIDEHVTTFYKALTYVYGGGLKDGEKGMELVGKAFADHAALTPVERQIAKSIIPFYSWTRHLLKYAFTYPVDHPVRAGIISNLATSEFEGNLKGLPRDFAQLFFLGDKAFDIRQVNPFRDFGNDVTLAGFVGSLNPAAGGILRAMGVNPVNASQELYPELTVDPNTGKLVTKRKNAPLALAETFVPQVQGIEGLLGFSDSLRTLKKNDPSAYWSTLARYLHFPWLPKNVNLPEARAQEELNQFRVAQQDVARSMKTGDFSQTGQFNAVPFQGQVVPPQTLQALYQLLQSKNTGYTPNTLLRK